MQQGTKGYMGKKEYNNAESNTTNSTYSGKQFS
jgi:hypothetical protein